MNTATRREIARNPLVRAAGYALLITCAAGAALILPLIPMPTVGTRTSPGALAAVLLTTVVLLVVCVVGGPWGRRWPLVPPRSCSSSSRWCSSGCCRATPGWWRCAS